MIKLRPHHLLCTQTYRGNGYSPAFVENMTALTNCLRNDTSAEIEIVFSTDDLCLCCPKKLGDDRCEQNIKVKQMDEKVIAYFEIRESRYNYHKLITKINAEITPAMLDDICGNCSWYAISDCKKILLENT